MRAVETGDNSKFHNFPFIIGWELTLRCNLRCSHCASSAGHSRSQELTLQEALNLCDQFPDLLVQEVDFTGGEPLISEHWPRIFAYLQKLDITTKVITNGLTLSQDMVGQLHDLGIAGIGVSLDGLSQTHDVLRGSEGLFDRVFRNIEHIQKQGIPLTIITTIHSQNISDLPYMLELLIEKGIDSWQTQPIFHLGRAEENAALQLSYEDYMKFGDFVAQKIDKAKERGLEIMLADSYGYFTHRDRREPPWRGCPAGLFSCGVTSDGKIKGCLSMPDELVEGDLRVRDLWDIWFDKQTFAYNRKYSTEDLGDNCKDCKHAQDCLGGCSAMSYGCTGEFHNNPYCFSRLENESILQIAQNRIHK